MKKLLKNRIWFIHSEINNEKNNTHPVDLSRMPRTKNQRGSNTVTAMTEQASQGLGRRTWKIIFIDWLLDSIRSYCSTTSMHGFSHMIRAESTSGERRAWIVIVTVAIIISLTLLWISWNWNEETPTVTVIESTHFPTWNVAFPAVTICNFNKISKSKAMKLAQSMSRPVNMTAEDVANLFTVIMYYSGGLDIKDNEYELLQGILNENNYTAQKLLNELSPSCSEMLFRCVWKGTQSRCDSLFQTINTTEGICCSFNYYGLGKNNYPKKLTYTIPNVPRRVTGSGYQTGLTVLLNPSNDDYFATYISSYGFRVLVHDAYDFPDENAETKVLTSARETFLSISPETTYATKDTRGLDIEARKCLFYDERILQTMQRYSYINCLAECRSALIYDKCRCVPVNLPSNGTLPICNVDNILCVLRNRDMIVGSLPGFNQTITRQKRPDKMPCNCLPDCEINQYPAEVTSGVLNREFSFNHVNLL